jgi:hypothetical protein
LLLIFYFCEVEMVEYQGFNLSQMQNEFSKINSEGGGSSSDYLQKYVLLPEKNGYVMIRLLPGGKGKKPFCATRIHTLTNPSTGKKISYHCTRNQSENNTWVGDCIICRYYQDLWRKSDSLSGSEQEKCQNQAREIKPVERYYFNCIVRSERTKDGDVLTNVGPKIYSCGKQVYSKILRACVGDEDAGVPGLGDVTHPTNGRDFRIVKKIVKSGAREYPSYDDSRFEDISPAGTSEEFASWLKNLHDLESLRSLKTQDELKHALRVHLGMVKEDASIEDELAEFRNFSSPAPQIDQKVREDLIVTTPTPSRPAMENILGEDILADDDFMKDLEM